MADRSHFSKIRSNFTYLASACNPNLFNLERRRKYTWVSITLTVVSLLIVLITITKNEKGAYKFTWAIFILVFPVFGGLFYLFFHIESGTNRFKNQIEGSRRGL